MITILFSQRCKFLKKVEAVDANGRPSYTETTIQDNVKCKLDPMRMRSIEQADPGAIQSMFRAMLYCEPVTGLTPDNLVELDSIRYQIISISPITNLTGTNHLELEVVRQQNV